MMMCFLPCASRMAPLAALNNATEPECAMVESLHIPLTRPSSSVLSQITHAEACSLRTMADVKEVKGAGLDPAREKYDSPPAESTVAEDFADINEKSLLRKLDYKLLPPLTILYLLSFLDRSNGNNK